MRPGSSTTLMALLAVATLAAAGGCQFGNYIDSTPTNPPSGDYGTTPQTLQFCVTTYTETPTSSTNDTATKCATAAVSLLPQELSSIFTDPVVINVEDQETGQTALTSSDGANGIGITSNSNAQLAVATTEALDVPWNDPSCVLNLGLQGSGSLSSTSGNSSGIATIGRMTMNLTVSRQFQGTSDTSCLTYLSDLANCFNDPSQCGSLATSTDGMDPHDWALSVFNTYINAGVMQATDIPNVVSMSYQVLYQ